MHHHHHHRSHRHYGCCPPGGCSSILSHCNPQSGARTRPSRGAAKVSMQPRRRQKGQTSRSFARSLSPRWLSMGCLYPGAERKPKFGVRTLSERGKLNKSLSENFIKASWWHFANARFHLRLAQVKNSNQGKDTHQHSSKEFIRETWAMRWKWRLSFMLHTNLNTWHAQNESCGKHWEWERGKMVGNPGIQTVKNPAHLTSPTSKMRCCYPFPLLAAAHKSHSSPCLQDVCHVYCCHSLSLSLSLWLLPPPNFPAENPPGNKDKQKYFSVFSCRKKFALCLLVYVLCVWVRALLFIVYLFGIFLHSMLKKVEIGGKKEK